MKKRYNEIKKQQQRKLTEDEVVVLDLAVPDLLVHGVTRVIHIDEESSLREFNGDLPGVIVV